MTIKEFREFIATGIQSEFHRERQQGVYDSIIATEHPADDAEMYNCHACGHRGTKPGAACKRHLKPEGFLDCAFPVGD